MGKTAGNELIVDYYATTDKPTVINLTHTRTSIWQAKGKRDILDHQVMIAADRLTPIDATSIPTGDLKPAEGTPFDFRNPTAIGSRIGQNDPQLVNGKGYDHNYVISRQGDGLLLAARVTEPTSGRVLEVSTTEPGIQLHGEFSGWIDHGKSGKPYQQRYGFCLEAQHFPDSPNRPNFPSTILKPGEEYRSKTVFAFGVSSN